MSHDGSNLRFVAVLFLLFLWVQGCNKGASERITVESSAMRSVGYDANTQTLD